MAQASLQTRFADSPLRRYGLPAVSCLLATVFSVLAEHYGFRDIAVPLYLFAISVSVWYAGSGPAALAVILSIVFFDYLFTEPRYSFYVSASELPYFAVFVAFAFLVAWFSAVRRRVERDLRQARDHLQIEVAERTQQASLLNLTHDTIFVRDSAGLITYWNRGAEELYGWAAENALGTDPRQLLKTVYPAATDQIHEELQRSGRWEGELKNTKADGTEVMVASRWSLRRDDAGRPLAILEINNDITERKHRELEIQSLNQELAKRSAALESTNKELEAFAYSVSHDLRAPLRHMAGYTELLQKRISGILDDKGKHYILMILESAKRMGALIGDLLAFSRIGRAEAQKTLVSLEQLLAEALNEVRQEAEGRQIAWKIGTLPEFYGDRSMMRLVLVNLLSNAIKFTRTRADAQIEVGSSASDRDELVVFVRDNGVGFDMQYANKLFGVFQRLHQAEAFEGTGIGLATVQRIIHRHGGRVWAEGNVDQGATFYFSAPNPRGTIWQLRTH
jgi:PAS domain S-box-containing protein